MSRMILIMVVQVMVSCLDELLDLKAGKKASKRPAASTRSAGKKPSMKKRCMHDAEEEPHTSALENAMCNPHCFLT